MAPEKDILLGIDFGTGGCKVTAIDFTGVVAGEASVEYPTHFPRPGWAEQTPGDWYASLCGALKKLEEKNVFLRRVCALSLDGSTHNAVLLDGRMTPLRDTIMWTDQRSTEECAFLKKDYGELIFFTAYQNPAPTWTLPQMMWLARHEPGVLKKTRHVLFVKDYVRYLLTGVAATDHIEAQGTLFYDMANRKWSDELTALSGLPGGVLPEFLDPWDVAGKVTSRAAAETGLTEGTPVICGTSDSAAEDYGAGAVEEGDCIVKLATAGNVNVMTAEPHPHARTLTYSHVVPGLWYTVSATNAAALCQRWMRDNFCTPEKREAEESGVNAFTLMDRLAAGAAPGAGGVFFHPYLQGERSPYWDAKLRGSFTGVSITSTRGDFIRALLEGVAFSLRECYGSIQEMGLPVKRIFLIGGGARSGLWSGIVSNVFDQTLQVPLPGDASFGTALLAGTGAGVFPDVREAVKRCFHVDCEVHPDPGTAAFYDKAFHTYHRIHDALAPVYAELQ